MFGSHQRSQGWQSQQWDMGRSGRQDSRVKQAETRSVDFFLCVIGIMQGTKHACFPFYKDQAPCGEQIRKAGRERIVHAGRVGSMKFGGDGEGS